MSLSERLKQAQQERSSTHEPAVPDPTAPVIDVTPEDGPVLDLTTPTTPTTAPIALFGIDGGAGAGTSTEGVSYSPIRTGGASSAFSEFDPVTADHTTGTLCPRCGGPTHLDMVDQVHQMASLSCLACFHMFQVEV